MNYLTGLSGKVKFNEPLSKHTTFGIGGEAKIWFEPENIVALRNAIKIARKKRIPIFIIGAGSNILVSDRGIKGMVINLNAEDFKRIKFKKKRVSCQQGLYKTFRGKESLRRNFGRVTVACGAGVKLPSLINKVFYRGLGGMEFLSGIPATLGGALFMNAGVSEKNPAVETGGSTKNFSGKNKSIGDLVTDVTLMDYSGNIKVANRKDLNFGYRSLGLSRYIILSAHLRLFEKDKRMIRQDINRYSNYRKKTQDASCASLGCIFKNPSYSISAGRLIDLSGLKGKSLGDAFISTKHANFIFNRGSAKAKDVLGLISLIKKKVKNRFDINLKTEIKIW